MILKYFSEYLRTTNTPPTFEALFLWLKERLELPAKCHEDKIIQAEIFLAKNSHGKFFMIAKNKTGHNLTKSLYHYVLSCQNIQSARNKHFSSSRKKSD